MNKVPEKGRDGRTGASHRPSPGNPVGSAGSVSGLSTPERKYLTGENAIRLIESLCAALAAVESITYTRPLSFAKARERSEQERGGGWEWWERVDGDGGRLRTTGKREAVRSRGGEAVPSAGWREVVEALDATEGSHHE